MPLLLPKKKSVEKSIKVNIDSNILDEILLYCEFSGLATHDDFFTQAAQFILSKDKEWIKKNKK